jgi:hypothetical protein
MFYQFGALQTWELTCELFEYSNERISTGIPEIDILQKNYSLNILDYTITTENGQYLTDQDGNFIVLESFNIETIDPAAQNELIQHGGENFPEGSDDFIDFTEKDPFSEGNI